MADYASDLNKIRSDIDKIQNQAGKALEELNKKTRSYASSWSEVGKKIKDSLDPVAQTNKNIAKLEAQRTDSLAKQQKFELKREEILQKTRQFNRDLVRFQDLNNIGQGNLTSAQLDELQQLQKIYNNRDSIRKLILTTYQANRKNLETTEKEIAKLEEYIDVQNRQSAQLALIKDTFIKLFQISEKYDHLLSEQAKIQGTVKSEIDEQYGQIQKINKEFDSNLASNQEMLRSATVLRKEYALTTSQLVSIGKESANISRLTGLTTEESVKFQTTLAEVAGTSIETQKSMTIIAAKAAAAANVPMGMVMRDVANISNGVRMIFRGNTTELIKQAAELRKIGSSLDSAAKSAEKLLDFESSIGAELKLSALLGKSINFNEARRLYFAGDLIGSEKALQRELEKVGDLTKLDYFQRKQLTEATGRDYNELLKIQVQKQNLLEAERMFPKEAAKMRKAQQELNDLQKKGADARKDELQLLLESQTAEAESLKLSQTREMALLNLGKLLHPIYVAIMSVQTAFFRLISFVTTIEDPIGKWAASSATAIVSLTLAFYTLRFGIRTVLDFLGNAFAVAAERTGEGIGRGLSRIAVGLRSLGRSMNAFSFSGVAKLTILMLAMAAAAWGVSKALENLGNVSVKQILAFTVGMGILIVTLGVMTKLLPLVAPGVGLIIALFGGLALSAIALGFALKLATPTIDSLGKTMTVLKDIVSKVFDTMLETFKLLPNIINSMVGSLIKLSLLGPSLIIAAAGITSLSISFGMLSITTAALIGVLTLGLPVLNSLGKTITTLSSIVGGVIITAFNTMLNVFKSLPTVITSVATGLKTITDIGFLKFASSASGINLIANSIKTFPINQLTTITDQLVRLGYVSANINDVINSLSKLSNSAIGIQLAVDSLKELSGLELPKLDINIKGTESLEKLSESKDKQTEEIKSGLAAVAQKIEILTNMMANGGIAVNLDGQLVSRGLATTNYRSGGFGQSTTRA